MKLESCTVKHCPSTVGLPVAAILHSIWGGWREIANESSFWFLLGAKNLSLLTLLRLSMGTNRIVFSQFYHRADSTSCFVNNASSGEHDAREKNISFHPQEEVSTAFKHMKTQRFSCFVNLKSTSSSLPFIHQSSVGKFKGHDFFFPSVCILYRQ